MTGLVRGANAPLSATKVIATFHCSAPADVSALLVGRDLRVRSDADLVFFNAPSASGVLWTERAIEIDLGAVPQDVHAVLIALSLTDGSTFGALPPPTFVAAEHSFTVDRLDKESAIVGLEIYRRGPSWKVRAVGQGYAGGLAALVMDHGVEVDDPGPAEPAHATFADEPETPLAYPTPYAHPARPAPGAQPQQPAPSGARPVEYTDRVWMIWEDASRSLASYRAAVEHSMMIRDDELTGRAPRGRSDELQKAAFDRLQADMAQLEGELAEHESAIGAEIAPFSSTSWLTWRPGTELGEGLLLGHLSADETATLRIPLVLRVPWRRGVWINRGTLPRDSTAYAWSLVTRFMAAVPPGTAGIDVIDPTGLSGAGWLHGLPPATVATLCGGGVASGHAVGDRLNQLLNLIDLRSVGGDDHELLGDVPPVRLVVIFDIGTALEQHGDRLMRLIDQGPEVGVPVICVETDTPTDESVRALKIKQTSHTLPSIDGILGDAWVGGDWTLTPDVMADASGDRPPQLLAHVLDSHTRSIERA